MPRSALQMPNPETKSAALRIGSGSGRLASPGGRSAHRPCPALPKPRCLCCCLSRCCIWQGAGQAGQAAASARGRSAGMRHTARQRAIILAHSLPCLRGTLHGCMRVLWGTHNSSMHKVSQADSDLPPLPLLQVLSLPPPPPPHSLSPSLLVSLKHAPQQLACSGAPGPGRRS